MKSKKIKLVVLFCLLQLISREIYAQVQWVGTFSSSWNDPGNWSGAVPDGATDVEITSGAPNVPLIDSLGATCKNLVVDNGATFSMGPLGELQVFGNIQNDGTFLSGGGTVKFLGDSAQSISGQVDFDNIYLNNLAGLYLNSNILIKSYFELENGNILTGANFVQLEENAFILPIGGFVDGNLKEFISEGYGVSVNFPIGNGSMSDPIDLYFDNVNTSGYVTASTSLGDHLELATSGFDATATVNRTWSLINSGVVFNEYTALFSFDVSEKDPDFLDSYATIKMYTSGGWIEIPNVGNAVNSHVASSLTSFGDFQIGSLIPAPILYSITPSVFAVNQTTDIEFNGEGFIDGHTSVNFDSDVTVNSFVVNSDVLCTANITISGTPTLGVHQVSLANSAPGGGTSNELDFDITNLPIPDFSASLLTILCKTDGSTTFTNNSINADSYVWNFGSGATPATATGFGPYTVTYSSTGNKTIKLRATNSNGSDSLILNNYINVQLNPPLAPSTINGLSELCAVAGTEVSFTCSNAAGATGYQWALPTGLTYVSGQGTSALTVIPEVEFTSGELTVNSTNNCGTSVASASLNLTSSLPVFAGSISGLTVLCGVVSTSYSIAPVVNANSYLWTVPSGVNITAGQGTSTITVSISSSSILGSITVQAISNCGNSAIVSKSVSSRPVAPSSITGPVSLCGVTTAHYTTTSLGATSYVWSLPPSITLSGGGSTSAVNVNVAANYIAGNISVNSTNSCGIATGVSMALYGKVPAMPIAITGSTNPCAAIAAGTNITYSIVAIAGAVSYNWTVPAVGATILSGQGTTSISVAYTAAYTTGFVTAQSIGVCGNSAVKAIPVTKVIPVAPSAIAGPTNVCTYSNSGLPATYSIVAVANASGYNWAVPANATIVSGQGTTSITVTFDPAYTTGSITVQSLAVCGSSVPKALGVAKTVPAAPLAISGPTNVCTYSDSGLPATYSIGAVTNATSYNWAVPANATIVSGQGTTSITVTFDPAYTTGSITVQSVAVCGNSIAKALGVAKTVPAAPVAITGPTNVCTYSNSGLPATYTVAAVVNATSYNWAVPANATIVSGQGTNSITVTYTPAYVSGSISVQSVAVCGNSVAKTLSVVKTIPAAPVAITGPTNVCTYSNSGLPATYSIAAVANATSYNWAVPANATIVSGQGSNSITVTFAPAYVSGSVSVQSVAVCGNSVAKTLSVLKTIPAAPLTISGATNVCAAASSGTPVTYTASAVAGIDSLHWVVPATATILSGWGTNSISVFFPPTYTTGSVSVQSCVVCGRSALKSVVVAKTIPTAPLAITGPTAICRYAGSVDSASYTIAAVAVATSYTWTVPVGASIISGQGTTHIGVMFASNAVAGSVTCKSNAGCGSSAARALAVTKTLPIATTITGNNSICDDITAGNSVPYTIAAEVPNASTYTWVVPAGASVTSGQGTSSVTVHFAITTPTGSLVKVAAVNSCATSAQVSYAVTTCLSPIVIETSTEQASTINSFSDLYPNPSAEYFNVDILSDVNKEVEIMVFDVNGNKVIDSKHAISAGATTLKTDFDKFSNGVYFVRIVDLSNHSTETRKLVK